MPRMTLYLSIQAEANLKALAKAWKVDRSPAVARALEAALKAKETPLVEAEGDSHP